MCDRFGGTQFRYDYNLVHDPVAKLFLSPQNSDYLRRTLEQKGYKIGSMQALLPYMYEVLTTTYNNGFDPSVCDRTRSFPIPKLNQEFINYVVPIFENEKCMWARYTQELKFPVDMPLPNPAADSCKHQELLYNNRW